MKTVLPWLVAMLALGSAALFFNANRSKSAAVAKLEADVQHLGAAATELEELKKTQVPPAEITQLRKDKEELLRLRNEVSQLRKANDQAAKAAQAAQGQIEKVQAQAVAAQQQALSLTTNLQALSAQQQALSQQVTAQQAARQQANMCVNQMRQIDAATQQWALETGKRDTDAPEAAAIAKYIRGAVIPTCPAGGTYSLAASVGANPVVVCSIPGHALPQSPPPQ